MMKKMYWFIVINTETYKTQNPNKITWFVNSSNKDHLVKIKLFSQNQLGIYNNTDVIDVFKNCDNLWHTTV